MKSFCSFIAWLSVTGFCMLMAAALFSMFYVKPHVLVNLPIPNQGSQFNHYPDTVQLDCMARNIFFEAGNQSAKGKMMVGMVVLERTKSPHFPSTVCGVVEQANLTASGNIIKHECSFSWMCDGKQHVVDFDNPTVRQTWNQSYTIAKLVMSGKLRPHIDMSGVTHYHANYVKPDWARNKNYKLVAVVGNHMFYRWKKANLPKLQVAMN
jgi:spore germination cell wall hydrolase CwlJ-like protein